MNRFPVVTLLLIFGVTLCYSQEAEQEVPFQQGAHTIGLNATGLILNFTDTEEDEYTNPFLFLYNWDSGTVNLRAAIGLEYRNSEEIHDGFTDKTINKTAGIDGRIGIGWDIFQEKRWKIMAGVDLIGGYHSSQVTNDTGFDKVTEEDKAWSIGTGPFINLAFYIAPRVSIGTESGLYFRYFENTTTELFENFPEFDNQKSKTTGSELSIILPTALFIQFHF